MIYTYIYPSARFHPLPARRELRVLGVWPAIPNDAARHVAVVSKRQPVAARRGHGRDNHRAQAGAEQASRARAGLRANCLPTIQLTANEPMHRITLGMEVGTVNTAPIFAIACGGPTSLCTSILLERLHSCSRWPRQHWAIFKTFTVWVWQLCAVL